MIPSVFAITLMVTLALGLIGCKATSLLSAQKPTASVKGMTVQGVDRDGFTMDFAVDVTNPNGFDLPVVDAAYAVEMAGVRALTGEARPQATLAANATSRLNLPVRTTYRELLDLSEALARTGGSVPYTLDASVAVDQQQFGQLIGSQRIPLKYSGTLDLASLLRNPNVLFSPAARSLARKVLGL